jgi:hypothetical protein
VFRPRSTRRRGGGTIVAIAFGIGLVLAPATSEASPRDDLGDAYLQAADQLNELQLDAALATLDNAVAAAEAAGISDHPALGQIHAMRAGIIFALTQDKAKTIEACIEAVKRDHYVQVPIELRSAELQQYCDEARSGVPAPSEPISHTPPPGTPGADIEFTALVNALVPDGGQVVLYWRPAGSDAEFTGMEMQMAGNYAYWTVLADEHNGKDLEYFFYAFDPSQRTIANLGDKTRPMLLKMDENAVVPGAEGKGGKEGDGKKGKKGKKGKTKSGLPRVFINLGFGIGAGIARGTAELTYEQYTPGLPNSIYGLREQACAVERWFAAGADLAPDQITFDQNLRTIQSAGSTILPFDASDDQQFSNFVAAYDPAYCSRRHPVSTGFALAPFHITPEVGVRVGRAVVISLFSRLQVVTGSKVFTDDPNKQLTQSFNLDVRSPQPPGFRQKPPFSWSIGAKVKYFFGKDDRKFRLFLGGFAGFGFARLRVPMNFANDRNGNSVPDSVEAAIHGPLNDSGQVDPDQCTVVWPYNQACLPGDAGTPQQADRDLAVAVRAATSTTDERVDTVVIGPGFVGAAFGFHYQVVKYFGLFAELDVGVWFPNTSSALFDLTVGPSLTF